MKGPINMTRPYFRSMFCNALIAAAVFFGAGTASDGAIIFSTPATAVQNVNLFGIDAVLTAVGAVQWNFDLDPNGNSILGGTSTIDALFHGVLPVEFAVLGVAGAAFDLFSIDNEIVTVTGNGTQVTVDTLFGLKVFGPVPGGVLAEFFTSSLSDFTSTVSQIPFGETYVFQSINRPADFTGVFIGSNFLGVPEGSLVGVSFNRTVTTSAAVPEPMSLSLSAAGLAMLAGGAWRKRKMSK